MLSSRLFRPLARTTLSATPAAAAARQTRAASSVARATIVGNVGYIQEEIVNPNVMNYTVAVNQKYSKTEEPTTNWYNVVVFGEGQVRTASELLKKGSMVYVDGELRIESYTDKNGNPSKGVRIIQSHMRVLKSPPGSEHSESAEGIDEVHSR